MLISVCLFIFALNTSVCFKMFLTLTPGGIPIRGVAVDGEEKWSVFDFINRVCEKPKMMKGGKLAENSFGGNTYSSLVMEGSKFKDEIEGYVSMERFKDSRGPKTPAMTVHGLNALLEILNGKKVAGVLNGKVSASVHAMVEESLAKVSAGDRTLISSVGDGGAGGGSGERGLVALEPAGCEVNAYDDRARNARESAGKTNWQEELSRLERKRQMIREDALFEVEIMERKQRIADAWQKTQAQALVNTRTVVDILSTLRQNGDLDGNTVMQIENQAKRIMLGEKEVGGDGQGGAASAPAVAATGVQVSQVPVVQTNSVGVSMNLPVGVPMNVFVGSGGAGGSGGGGANGDGNPGSSTSAVAVPVAVADAGAAGGAAVVYNDATMGFISISGVSKDMGIKCTCGQLKELGKRMAEKYRGVFSKDPVKRRQQVGGQILMINSYQEKDRPMMEEVIRDYFVNVGGVEEEGDE